jgi:Cation transport ATPase
MKPLSIPTESMTHCYHCGELNESDAIEFDETVFCSTGCKVVYEIISQHQLCSYYTYTPHPGISQPSPAIQSYYDFLDKEYVIKKLIDFRNNEEVHVHFQVPNLHCSSCIWLFENLSRLHSGIKSSRVNFMERDVKIIFHSTDISLKEKVILLKKIGNEPRLNLESLQEKEKKIYNRSQLYKLGIAGCCFGNTMMINLPDNFSGGDFLNDAYLNHQFNYLSLFLSLPVLLYGAQEFFVNSYENLKQ